MPPAFSDEERENQLIALAYDAVEARIREGTASSQELVHFLKMGSTREKKERQIMDKQEELLTAKTSALESQKNLEGLMREAMLAFREYAGDDSGQVL
ncbi:MAG: hypothetical protein J6U54_19745 [Clostridiales bacterium]|nr:hypothetical protein [Clostridiales bacterium]